MFAEMLAESLEIIRLIDRNVMELVVLSSTGFVAWRMISEHLREHRKRPVEVSSQALTAQDLRMLQEFLRRNRDLRGQSDNWYPREK